MDRGAWWATVHIVTESDTTEATPHTHTHTHTRAILTGAVLICIYLVIGDFEHLFMYQRRYTNHFHHLLAVQISFLWSTHSNILSVSKYIKLMGFKNLLVGFLNIVWTCVPFSYVQCKISHFVACLFALIAKSFHEQLFLPWSDLLSFPL